MTNSEKNTTLALSIINTINSTFNNDVKGDSILLLSTSEDKSLSDGVGIGIAVSGDEKATEAGFKRAMRLNPDFKKIVFNAVDSLRQETTKPDSDLKDKSEQKSNDQETSESGHPLQKISEEIRDSFAEKEDVVLFVAKKKNGACSIVVKGNEVDLTLTLLQAMRKDDNVKMVVTRSANIKESVEIGKKEGVGKGLINVLKHAAKERGVNIDAELSELEKLTSKLN
jgi:hypothetical protein